MGKGEIEFSSRDKELFHQIHELKDRPLDFVRFIFPWGERGTPLHNFSGPRNWQCEEFEELGDFIEQNKILVSQGKTPRVFKKVIAAGRGPGKSAFSSMFTSYTQSCVWGGTQIVTANTEAQLRYKTFPEINKWQTLARNAYWFDRTKLKVSPKPWFSHMLKEQLHIDTEYYYALGQPWSSENVDAFAGNHSQIGFSLVMDEASTMPQKLFDVSAGFFTDPSMYRFWYALGNPRRNQGAFYNCFYGKAKAFWKKRQIDSRKVEDVDLEELDQIVQEHGEESDVTKTEVRGEFPSLGDAQFISRDLILEAQKRRPPKDEANLMPLIMAVDPARFGDSSTVFFFRRGRDAFSIPRVRVKNRDTTYLVSKAVELIKKYDPDYICIDSGQGHGLIDGLRALKYKVKEVHGSGSSPNPYYANYRTYLWSVCRDWLKGGFLVDDVDLMTDLSAPEYDFKPGSDKTILESKKSMRKRGVASPDDGDALVYTFAIDHALPGKGGSGAAKRKSRKPVDWSPFRR